MVYGGYDFSPLQLEVLAGYSPDTLTEIGKIMTSSRRGYEKRRDIDLVSMVGDIIMRLDWHDSENEEKTMREYFLNCEFDTVAEVHEFYDSSAFLKTHPELKNEVVGIALQGLKDSQEWAEKHIVIRKGKSVKAIEKGQEIPPGWEIK